MKLTVKDVSRLLNIAEKTVYRWIQSGSLPAYRVEGQYRINKSLLLEWATAKKINISPELFIENGEGEVVPTLLDSLKAGGIHYRIGGNDKLTVLKNMVDLLYLPESVNREFFFSALWARESLQSTAVGEGIAFPHVRNPMIFDVDKPIVSLGFLEKPVDFDALDHLPVKVLFTLITPTVGAHLHLLSHLAFICRDESVKKVLDCQANREDIFKKIEIAENNLVQQKKMRAHK